MSKWFDNVDNRNSGIVYSRIRLVRNRDEYTLPSRMTAQQCGEMPECIKKGLRNLPELGGNPYKYQQLNEARKLEKLALREHRILGLIAMNKEESVDLLLSGNESSSLVLGGGDHIRIQFLASSSKLDEL